MGQNEILMILKTNKKVWLDASQISVLVGVSTPSTSRILKILKNTNQVQTKLVALKQVRKHLYKYKETK